MTDEELAELGNEVLLEKELRASLASIPGQISALSAAFRAGGGDVSIIRDAVG